MPCIVRMGVAEIGGGNGKVCVHNINEWRVRLFAHRVKADVIMRGQRRHVDAWHCLSLLSLEAQEWAQARVV